MLMLEMRARLLIILLIAVIAVAVFYGRLLGEQKTPHHRPNNHAVELYMHQVNIHALDDSGQLTLRVNSDNISKFKDSKKLHFVKPAIDIIQVQSHWQIRADSAHTNDTRELITLEKNVIVQRADASITLTTEQLNIDTKKQTASSSSNIQVIANNSQTQAQGMHIDMQQETILLESQVSTLIAPRRK